MYETTDPPIIVGPSKFGTEGQLYIGRYADGMIALAILDQETGETISVATVCMVATTTYKDKRHVWLKDWSENEGLIDQLVKANVVELTGNTTPAGHAIAIEGRITDTLFDAMPKIVQDYINNG